MHIVSIFLIAVLVAIRGRLAHGLPAPGQLERRDVPCNDISMYDVDYFTEAKIYEPPGSTCLFYTAWLSATAQRFAHSGGSSLTTIWDMWPCDLYNGDTSDLNNPLRCFFEDANNGNTADRTTYFEHMSEAMAISCDVFATVMTNFTDNIPQDGIWGRIEQPALQRETNPGVIIDTIVAVDLTGDNLVTVWDRPTPGPVKKRGEPTEAADEFIERSKVPRRINDKLTKRDQPNGCYSPDQLQEWFGGVPW